MFEETLTQLKVSLANPVNRVFPLKEAIRVAKAKLSFAFYENSETKIIINEYSNFISEVLGLAWDEFSWTENNKSWRKSRISLLAVGGFGRKELLPHSDIDILILLERNDVHLNKDNIQSFVTLLWDVGLNVGHSVRSLRDCKQEALSDVTSLTSMSEARVIRGNLILLQKLDALLHPKKIWQKKKFYLAKANEQKIRHEKSDYTEYSLEPNVKTSPGGLRDIQTLQWIATRTFATKDLMELVGKEIISRSEYESLVEARAFLWKVRFGLHTITGRDENRLLFSHQQSLAKHMNYHDKDQLAVEQFMKDYYIRASTVNTINETLMKYFEEEIWEHNKNKKIIKLDTNFNIVNNLIELSSPSAFQNSPSALFEMFLWAARDSRVKGFSSSAIRLAQKHIHLINDEFRADPKNNATFLKILSAPNHLFTQLRRMSRWGILGAYLPEFQRVIGHMQFDLFHSYTVDAHTLQVVRNMRRFRYKNNEQKFPIAAHIHSRLPRIELLYIAGFYHDLGKGLKGDHSKIGTTIVKQFCVNHRLPLWDTNLVCWLVENHLVMSTTAQREDIQDPNIIHNFARFVGDQTRLDYLYALTVADMNATNPNLWNGWRASLMNQLYYETKRTLRKGLAMVIDRNEYLEDTRHRAMALLEQQGLNCSEIERVWARVDDEYFLKERVSDITWHTNAIIQEPNSEKPIVLVRNDNSEASDSGYTQIFVHTKNRKDLFTSIISAIDELQLNVVDARIATSKDNKKTFNSFAVLEKNGLSVGDNETRIERIRSQIEDSIEKPENKSRYLPFRQSAIEQFVSKTRISIHKKNRENLWAIEVTTADRPGVLAVIGDSFKKFDMEIVSARITTLGEKVEDIFYVSSNSISLGLEQSKAHQLKLALQESLDNHAQKLMNKK
ncbi:[protein-PII] uridylyltransferase [Gammaproteobacteria bacterium]|nr:[protein-PII] uridylyltransferase [Gammaproteobacteria bacterium]